VFAVLDAGSFFPRLLEPDGSAHERCTFCEVQEACLRGDSGSRLRLERWAKAQSKRSAAAPAASAEQAAFAIFELPGEAVE